MNRGCGVSDDSSALPKRLGASKTLLMLLISVSVWLFNCMVNRMRTVQRIITFVEHQLSVNITGKVVTDIVGIAFIQFGWKVLVKSQSLVWLTDVYWYERSKPGRCMSDESLMKHHDWSLGQCWMDTGNWGFAALPRHSKKRFIRFKRLEFPKSHCIGLKLLTLIKWMLLCFSKLMRHSPWPLSTD